MNALHGPLGEPAVADRLRQNRDVLGALHGIGNLLGNGSHRLFWFAIRSRSPAVGGRGGAPIRRHEISGVFE